LSLGGCFTGGDAGDYSDFLSNCLAVPNFSLHTRESGTVRIHAGRIAMLNPY